VRATISRQLRRPCLFEERLFPRDLLSANWGEADWVRRGLNEETISTFLECMSGLASSVFITFDEYRYMGSVQITSAELNKITMIAKELNDPVVCYFDNAAGGLIVDYYDDKMVDQVRLFSLLIFGEDLLLSSERCRQVLD